MPAEGVQLQAQDRLLSTDEILRIAELFVRVGVTKIRLTGGEPLVRKDLVSLTRSLKALGLTELAVTTNGVAPASKYADLVAAGMTHFNISLDTLQPARFASISRRPAKYLEAVQANLAQLLGPLGVGGRVKINNVVMRGVNDDELADFVALTAEQELDVRFIEWMPFDSNGWNKKTFVPYTEMISRLQEAFHSVARAVDAPHDTTKWWRVPGYKGRVGFITSMSQHFCGSCNRLRVTADGKLKVCLFGAEDLSLRDALREGRTEEELLGMVGRAVGLKKFSLGGQEDMFALAKSKNRPMILIGG
jgi:cyclic pyranopterin phosphate synthase